MGRNFKEYYPDITLFSYSQPVCIASLRIKMTTNVADLTNYGDRLRDVATFLASVLHSSLAKGGGS